MLKKILIIGLLINLMTPLHAMKNSTQESSSAEKPDKAGHHKVLTAEERKALLARPDMQAALIALQVKRRQEQQAREAKLAKDQK